MLVVVFNIDLMLRTDISVYELCDKHPDLLDKYFPNHVSNTSTLCPLQL